MVPTIPGKILVIARPGPLSPISPLFLNTALGIESPAIYDKTGETIIDPAKVGSIDELIEATIENYKWLVHRLVIMDNIIQLSMVDRKTLEERPPFFLQNARH